ncbi:type VI secretion system contractile sheath domain-containing protein [Pedobacter cryophilus]|uniref:Uncharacterized protein n=1 Tax=Pedobacter cryophilus TaxID=2571271 RepID=A0A4U1BXE6_9SPHI|nr:type VI secretion system contractile sheath large subunit [Pedobacter cryophilus]TKB97034.1 hypothetical protein FA046_13275 [Pedobacter cryophilus]
MKVDIVNSNPSKKQPRAVITYDVYTNGNIIKQELPFIVGVLADLSGEENLEIAFPAYKKNSFIEINSANFKEVMGLINPKINFETISSLSANTYLTSVVSSWYGLYNLVSNIAAHDNLKLRVLNVSKKTLQNDFEKESETDQSILFKKIYEAAYGTYSGDGYSLLIGDYGFEENAVDNHLLEKLNQLGTILHAPFISNNEEFLSDLVPFKNQPHRDSRISDIYYLTESICSAFAIYSWPVISSHKLSYLLVANRFAQYIKVIIKNKIGSFLTRSNIEDYLNTWLSNYVLLDDHAPENANALFPLREASIIVSDIPEKPGEYKATLFIKSHFKLAELTQAIRLEILLPSA